MLRCRIARPCQLHYRRCVDLGALAVSGRRPLMRCPFASRTSGTADSPHSTIAIGWRAHCRRRRRARALSDAATGCSPPGRECVHGTWRCDHSDLGCSGAPARRAAAPVYCTARFRARARMRRVDRVEQAYACVACCEKSRVFFVVRRRAARSPNGTAHRTGGKQTAAPSRLAAASSHRTYGTCVPILLAH